MGCFLACFGFSNKQNRRNHPHKRNGSYDPLASSITIVSLDTEDSELRLKPKEQLSSRIRKKVSFNLNVQTYEPISTDYHLLSNRENDEKTLPKENVEETEQRRLCSERPDSGGSSSLNYRYRNCRDYYDEEDDIAFEDSDLDDYEDDFDFIDGDNDEDSDIERLRESQDSDKGHYVHSVLKPIENISQWRAAKAKEAAPRNQQNQRKENISMFHEPQLPNLDQSKPLPPEIRVDSSLSNWLNSSST